MAKVKGITLLGRVASIKGRYGEEELNRVLALMKEESRELLGSVIPSSWYDANVFKDFNEAICKALSKTDPAVMEHLGEMMAEAGLTGVYSSRLKEGDVRQTLSRATPLWKTFHDTGELTMEMDPERNFVLMRIAGYETPHHENCLNLLGWGRRMVELAGGRNARVKEKKCVCNGDDCCEMTVEWD